mgnify:CR=1 FL=1
MIATMLIENYGCDLNPVDLNGDSPTIIPFLVFSLPFIQPFLHSSNPNLAFGEPTSSVVHSSLTGMTPLHGASLVGNLPFVQCVSEASRIEKM